MKIAIFTDSFIPQINGVVTSTINLAKGLADKGNKVFIIAPKYKNIKEFNYPSIQVKRVPGIPALFYEEFKFTYFFSIKLLKYLKKEKIDIIHFQTPLTLGAQAIILSRRLKVPLVGTFHTFFMDPEYLKHIKINNKLVQKLAWFYARMYYNKCNLITCPSEVAKEEIISNGLIKTIKVISNGIDTKFFDNSKWKDASFHRENCPWKKYFLPNRLFQFNLKENSQSETPDYWRRPSNEGIKVKDKKIKHFKECDSNRKSKA